MFFADGWRTILVPFEQVLGPLTPTAPILGATHALLGHYRGRPVWLVWTQETGSGHSAREAGTRGSAMMSIAMSLGDQIEGYIMTEDVLRNRPPVSDAAFFDVFRLRITPAEVGPRALESPQTRAVVQRLFRGGGGTAIMLNEGYLWTHAEFHVPPDRAVKRPPTPEELVALVDDVAHLTDRFREDFVACYAEIARSRGDAVAQAWAAQARAAAQRVAAKNSMVRMLLVGGGIGCLSLILLATLGFAWLFSS